MVSNLQLQIKKKVILTTFSAISSASISLNYGHPAQQQFLHPLFCIRGRVSHIQTWFGSQKSQDMKKIKTCVYVSVVLVN